jgi:lysophospholipase
MASSNSGQAAKVDSHLTTEREFQHWAHDNPQAVIVIVHGLGEFCLRYDWAASQLVNSGYAVLSRDLPGHGPLAEPRGHIEHFDVFLDTLDSLFDEAARRYPAKPIVLFGHSMGGLISVRYAQMRSFPEAVKAMVLSSPSLQTSVPVSPATIRFARILAAIWPTFKQTNRIAPEVVSRSPEVQAFYRSNEDILHKMSLKFLLAFLDAMDASIAQPTTVGIPVLTMQAGADKLVSVPATTAFHEKLTAPAKDFKLYAVCYHELLNEPEREQVMADIVTWLRQHVS